MTAIKMDLVQFCVGCEQEVSALYFDGDSLFCQTCMANQTVDDRDWITEAIRSVG